MNDGIRNEIQAELTRGPFPWQRGWSIVKAIWPQLIYISLAAIAIPQYGLYLISAQRASRVVRDLSSHPVEGLFPLLEIVEKFGFSGIMQLFWAALLAVWGYLAWVTAVWHHIDGQKLKTWTVFTTSLRIFLPSGLFALILFGLCLLALLTFTALVPAAGIVTQLVLISTCVLAASAPILLVMDRAGAPQVLTAAFRMEYTRGSGVTRWSAYFVLLTYEMLLVGSLSLIQAGLEAFNHLDVYIGLPRQVWFNTSSFFPFGMIPMLTEGFAITCNAFMFALFAVMSTSFVADLRRIGRIRSTIEIRV